MAKSFCVTSLVALVLLGCSHWTEVEAQDSLWQKKPATNNSGPPPQSLQFVPFILPPKPPYPQLPQFSSPLPWKDHQHPEPSNFNPPSPPKTREHPHPPEFSPPSMPETPEYPHLPQFNRQMLQFSPVLLLKTHQYPYPAQSSPFSVLSPPQAQLPFSPSSPQKLPQYSQLPQFNPQAQEFSPSSLLKTPEQPQPPFSPQALHFSPSSLLNTPRYPPAPQFSPPLSQKPPHHHQPPQFSFPSMIKPPEFPQPPQLRPSSPQKLPQDPQLPQFNPQAQEFSPSSLLKTPEQPQPPFIPQAIQFSPPSLQKPPQHHKPPQFSPPSPKRLPQYLGPPQLSLSSVPNPPEQPQPTFSSQTLQFSPSLLPKTPQYPQPLQFSPPLSQKLPQDPQPPQFSLPSPQKPPQHHQPPLFIPPSPQRALQYPKPPQFTPPSTPELPQQLQLTLFSPQSPQMPPQHPQPQYFSLSPTPKHQQEPQPPSPPQKPPPQLQQPQFSLPSSQKPLQDPQPPKFSLPLPQRPPRHTEPPQFSPPSAQKTPQYPQKSHVRSFPLLNPPQYSQGPLRHPPQPKSPQNAQEPQVKLHSPLYPPPYSIYPDRAEVQPSFLSKFTHYQASNFPKYLQTSDTSEKPQDPQAHLQQPQYQQAPHQTNVQKQPSFQSCEVAVNQRISCGDPDISASACEAISCCFDGQMCYFGKAVTVQCTRDAHFIVVVARDATLPNINLQTISLLGGGQGCTHVDSNSEFAIYYFPITACGSKVKEEPGAIIYENRMTSSYEVAIGPLGAITRDSQYDLVFHCRYIGTSVETLIVEILPLQSPPLPVSAVGPIKVIMRLANGQCYTKGCDELDVAYNSFYMDADYPVTKVLRDPVYVEVQLLEKTDPMLVLTLGRCWVTTSPYPHSFPQWDILVDGCPNRDDRYLSSLIPVGPNSGLEFPSHYRRFLFKMFTLLGPMPKDHMVVKPMTEKLYLHCSTALCVTRQFVSCEPACFMRERDQDQEKNDPKTVVSSGAVIMTAPEQ